MIWARVDGDLDLGSGSQVSKKWSDSRDFPGGPVVKTARFQRKGRGFDLWSGDVAIKKRKKERKGSREGGRKKWSDSRYNLKVDPPGFIGVRVEA